MYRRYLFLFAAAVIPYIRVFRFGYVNYDDSTFIGIALRDFSFTEIFGKFLLFDYIPLTHMSFWFERILAGGMLPVVSHGINLGLHAINTILVFYLASHLFKTKGFAAYITAFAFALHPMNMESVAWVTERKGLLAAAFFLTGLLVYLRRLERREQTGSDQFSTWVVITVLFLAALLSKPVALSFPIVLLILDYWTWRKDKRILMWAEKIPFLALSLAFGAIHAMARRSATAIELSPGYWGEAFAAMPRVISHYLSSFLYPVGMNVFYTPRNLQVHWMGALLFVMIAVLALALAIARRGDRRQITCGLLFFFVILAPHLKIVPYGLAFVAADRYFYLSGLGLIFLLVFVLQELYFHRKWLAIVVAAFCLVTWGLQIQQILPSWENSGTLWSRVIQTDPRNALALNNFGLHLLDEKKFDLARKQFELSVQADPAYAHPWVNLAYISAQANDLVRAREFLREALKRNPGSVEVLESLSRIERALAEPAK